MEKMVQLCCLRNSAGQGGREREGLEEEMPTIGIWPIGEGSAMGGKEEQGELSMARVQDSPHVSGGKQHFLTLGEKTECFLVTKEGVASGQNSWGEVTWA